MARLFNRQFALRIGATRIASSLGAAVTPTLAIAFKVEKNSQKEPNPAEVTIWNLSRDSRATIDTIQAGAVAGDLTTGAVTLEVGYEGQTFHLFTGDLVYAGTQRQGTDWVTRLQVHDGSARFRSARINESMGPGTLLSDAIKVAAGKLGVGTGNLLTHLTNKRSGWQSFGRGVVLSGKAESELDKLLKSAGYEWSIQDGQLQVLEPKETTTDPVVVLNRDSGLIGSPEKSTKEGERGHVKARSLLQPGLTPGRRVRINGEVLSGDFKVLRTVFTGDTWGTEWYADIEGSPL